MTVATAEAGTSASESKAGEDQSDLPLSHGQDNGDPENELPPPPIRETSDFLPCVQAAAETVTRCSEAETKNYMATADYACRQLAVQMADLWKEVCRAAKKASNDGERAAVTSLSFKIKVDQTNLLVMSTKVSLGFSRKFACQAETTEDLRQVKLNLQGEQSDDGEDA